VAGASADIQWLCVCDCGVQKPVYAFNLTDGGTVSGGCWRANANLWLRARAFDYVGSLSAGIPVNSP
jgi:hypothetical protein